MKKVIFAFVFGAILASCGNSTPKEDTLSVDSVQVDTVTVDSVK